MNARNPPREAMLFLSFTYPSAGGSGAQRRSAALIRMLSAHADVHLLIGGYCEAVGGPRDPELEALCRTVAYLRVLPGAEGKWRTLKEKIAGIALPTIDCERGKAADAVLAFYERHGLDSLFVFRFDALHFVADRLDAFPVRYLDLDELPSRLLPQFARLKRKPGEPLSPPERAAHASSRMLESFLIPRFQRVFVSSEVEVEAVGRQTNFRRAQVLPNVYPVRPEPPGERKSGRSEMLFVGSLASPANADAVVNFCREILPVIREKKEVAFLVIGMGGTDPLESVKGQAGVELLGYREDLAPFYARAAFVVAPLRAGAGTRLKILEAFAFGRAVVSTLIGAEGLEVTDRENMLLADDPRAFAAACIELLEHPDLAERIAEGASRLHRERYSQEALSRRYEEILAGETAAL